eukprot:TRINITY_DN35264_c0_g2_i1.p1 TRINITY_DN35264_c0_g2~~TRINITY_DN35264_c0_g2_i1.p1  ORF type:complete len:699 (+),score=79.21 TRINITY_DN35264_c0_g2_i1:48-2099(+)
MAKSCCDDGGGPASNICFAGFPFAVGNFASHVSERCSVIVMIGVGALVVMLSAHILYVDEVITLCWLGTLVNIMLSIVKLWLAQHAIHRKALMADALHGLGDTIAEIVTAAAYTEAARPPDHEHPWGHGKIESVGAACVSCVLMYISVSMGWESLTTLAPIVFSKFRRMSSRDDVPAFADVAGKPVIQEEATANETDDTVAEAKTNCERTLVRRAAIAVTLASVVLKETLFMATLRAGERLESNLVMVTAWHHRSDSLAAIVALASQLGASVGHEYLDPVGSGAVASMIGNSAIGNLFESFNDLIDFNSASENASGRTSCGREALTQTIATVQGVRNHTLRTRRMGPYCLVDVTIVVDARISASAASMIAEGVHDRVVGDFKPYVTDVVVHVDPEGSPQSHRLETHAETDFLGDAIVSPEDIEWQIREVLMSVGDSHPDLPRIAEVSELQTYYYITDELHSAKDDTAAPSPPSPYVDVKVDVRLSSDDVTIRSATLVARAARASVLAAFPSIVRDIDVDLELAETTPVAASDLDGEKHIEFDEDGQSLRTSSSTRAASSVGMTSFTTSPFVREAGSLAKGQQTHGCWADDTSPISRSPFSTFRTAGLAAPRPSSRTSGAVGGSVGDAAGGTDECHDRARGTLQRMTLIWERGCESRQALVRPTLRHEDKSTWRPVRSHGGEGR